MCSNVELYGRFLYNIILNMKYSIKIYSSRALQTFVRSECYCFCSGTVGKQIVQRIGSMLSSQ